jgi:hypothetical protein
VKKLGYVLLVVAALTLLRSATLITPIFNSDEAYIAVQAHVLAHGGHLYRDIADRKPPLVPYLYVAVFALRGSDDLIAVHGLAIAWLALTGFVLYRIAAAELGAAGAVAALALFVCSTTTYLPAETLAANFEVFMLLPSCLAVLASRRRGAAAALLAGAAAGLAGLCKQTAVLTLVPVVFNLRRQGRDLVLALVGFAATLAAAVVVSPRELYFWTVGGNAGYLSVRGVLAYSAVRFAAVTATFALANGVLCFFVLRAWRTRARADTDLWLWLLSSAVGVAAGLRFFGHYYLQLLPPACLLAARPAALLAPRVGRRWAAAVALPALAAMVAGFFSTQIHGMPDYAPLAQFVREHTAPSDRIAIWGHFPEVYWASGRMPAIRFVHTGFLTGASGGRPSGTATASQSMPFAWDILFQDLAAHPPRMFIDTAPAGLRDYANYPIARYPRLAQFVAEHYHKTAIIDRCQVYERTEAQTAEAR